jgi:histidine ammonia-lyase
MQIISLTGDNLTIDEIYHLSHKTYPIQIEIKKEVMQKITKAREYVLATVAKKIPVYGINTGFGALADRHIKDEDLSTLQYNLIRSHCTGVGEPYSIEQARAIMLLRTNCLVKGHSGISPEIIKLLVDFINHDIVPIIPKRGSVGASGDLAPLSHIALCLIGEGDVYYKDKKYLSGDLFKKLNLSPAILGPKDGLALINGTAVMTALASLALYRAKNLAIIADIAGAMSLEALKGTTRAFDIKISQLKPHAGQLDVCHNLNHLINGSEILNSHHDCSKVQDPYSLRCMPQVHGAARQSIYHATEVCETEINSVTDNPLIFVDEDDVISGGNFHGQAIAMAMDYLCMGLSELCSISERRVEKLMNPTFSELPAFLTPDSGLNSGLMIAHVTMAALASECKTLCHPASVDSIPTSTDKEDHVSMGITAGLKLWQIVDNTSYCLAIELLCATQGLDFHLGKYKSSQALMAVYEQIRNKVATIDKDRVLHHDIENIFNMIINNEIINAAKKHTNQLK